MLYRLPLSLVLAVAILLPACGGDSLPRADPYEAGTSGGTEYVPEEGDQEPDPGEETPTSPWRVLAFGQMSYQTTAQNVVARTPSEYADVYALGWSSFSRPEEAPPVDFSDEMVVAVFLGWRDSGGYDAVITNVEVGIDSLLVDYAERRWYAGTDGITYPYVIAAVPRVGGPVTFQGPEIIMVPPPAGWGQ